MWGLRRQVSLLVANGHPHAPHYPVHRVVEEVALVTERINSILVTEALLTQMAVSSLFSKEAGKAFKEIVEGLNGKA